MWDARSSVLLTVLPEIKEDKEKNHAADGNVVDSRRFAQVLPMPS